MPKNAKILLSKGDIYRINQIIEKNDKKLTFADVFRALIEQNYVFVNSIDLRKNSEDYAKKAIDIFYSWHNNRETYIKEHGLNGYCKFGLYLNEDIEYKADTLTRFYARVGDTITVSDLMSFFINQYLKEAHGKPVQKIVKEIVNGEKKESVDEKNVAANPKPRKKTTVATAVKKEPNSALNKVTSAYRNIAEIVGVTTESSGEVSAYTDASGQMSYDIIELKFDHVKDALKAFNTLTSEQQSTFGVTNDEMTLSIYVEKNLQYGTVTGGIVKLYVNETELCTGVMKEEYKFSAFVYGTIQNMITETVYEA